MRAVVWPVTAIISSSLHPRFGKVGCLPGNSVGRNMVHVRLIRSPVAKIVQACHKIVVHHRLLVLHSRATCGDGGIGAGGHALPTVCLAAKSASSMSQNRAS